MLSAGARLGPYEILSHAGAGGMGEVYRARDTRLDRIVAIKVLSANLGSRPEALQRFEREARAISGLNHANICSLYDVGTENGSPYLVMEYVEGETLSDRLGRGPLPIADALNVAIQIGEALDQAHRRGITHRDLKPGNVMLAGGKGSTAVKLLDFGLAKLPTAQAASSPGTLTSLPTVAQSLTSDGAIIGTFQYMAPEQLEGKDADARTDIFAFGCVLYEMVTGRKAFSGQSQASLISSIMTAEPPSVASIQPMSPPALDRVIRQCLSKDPDDRWQTARDLVRELRWIAGSSSQASAAPALVARRRRRLGAAWIAAVIFAVAFLSLGAVHFTESPPVPSIVRFLVPAPENRAFGAADTISLSPDGRRMLLTASTSDGQRSLWLRAMDSTTAKPVAGGEGAVSPFWSPDGRYAAIWQQGKLRKIDLFGGPSEAICDTRVVWGGTWNRDGVILFATTTSSPIMRVSAAGGSPAPATRLAQGESGHTWPSFLPDGRHFLFTVNSTRQELRGVYAGSLDSPEMTRIISDETNAQYAAPGYLIFVRGDVLMARPFDAKRVRVTGDAFPVGEQAFGFSITPGGAFSAAGAILAYRLGTSAASSELAWFDRKGALLGQAAETSDYTNPALSPDGRILAIAIRDPATRTRDLWLLDLARGSTSRFTFDPADDLNPTWSPDGRQIAFTSDRLGQRNLYVKDATGARQEELLLQSDVEKNCLDWTADGKYLLYNNGPGNKRDVWALPLTGDRKPFAVVHGPGNQSEVRISPNGKWAAYTSNENGRQEIYVQSFPQGEGKWQVSTAGGADPQWRRDGKELFYVQSNALMAVAVQTGGDRFERDLPKKLFEAPFLNVGRNRYVATADGQKFLGVLRSQTAGSPPVTVVVNWASGLKR